MNIRILIGGCHMIGSKNNRPKYQHGTEINYLPPKWLLDLVGYEGRYKHKIKRDKATTPKERDRVISNISNTSYSKVEFKMLCKRLNIDYGSYSCILDKRTRSHVKKKYIYKLK
jgi:hypothetical protein